VAIQVEDDEISLTDVMRDLSHQRQTHRQVSNDHMPLQPTGESPSLSFDLFGLKSCLFNVEY
jgi:hypothetical protein